MTLFEWSIFGIRIAPTWYGLMYALGFILCYEYMKRTSKIPIERLDILLLYVFFGVIVGGRIGYVLLYDAPYFFAHPQEILQVWKGGMSFHGGALGVILALFLFSKKYSTPLFSLSDPLVTILPGALGLGRIGNFINNELPGYAPYDGIFPMYVRGIAHFPSPLLQAFLEGIVLLFIMLFFRHGVKRIKKPGETSGLFLMGYGYVRLIAECFRLPDTHIGYLFGTSWMTLGMLYTLPFLLLGVYLFRR